MLYIVVVCCFVVLILGILGGFCFCFDLVSLHFSFAFLCDLIIDCVTCDYVFVS